MVDGTLGTVKVQYVKIMDGTLDGTSKATVNANGVKVDASGAAVPVTDNSGSLTVDAPVGTPVATRLSDGAAFLIGQKAMAASIPVALASDQASVPVAATLAAETTKVLGVVRTSDALGNSFNSSGPGFLRMTDEPRQLFYDPFDGAVVDVTNRWTLTTAVGTVTQSAGQAVFTSGATASGNYATLGSQVSLVPTIPAWLGFSFAINLPDLAAPPANGTRYWGSGTITTPTAAIPVIDGVGFELLGAKLYAVVYANGVRTAVQDLSAATGNGTQPTDANNHRYIVQYRTDRTYWYIDTLATPVATSSFQSPQVQTLPVRVIAVSSSAASVVINCAGLAAWDTGKNNTQLSDGTYPWRKATISAAGALKTDGSAVTQPVSGTFFQATQPVSAAALTDGTQVTQIRPSTLVVTGTAAAGTGVTITLPAVASQFHYIHRINIVKYASVATVGAAAPTVITSTNLPGSLAWTLPTALAVGTQYETDIEPTSPLKSSTVNTATTIVAGALASIIYRITVYYYTAA